MRRPARAEPRVLRRAPAAPRLAGPAREGTAPARSGPPPTPGTARGRARGARRPRRAAPRWRAMRPRPNCAGGLGDAASSPAPRTAACSRRAAGLEQGLGEPDPRRQVSGRDRERLLEPRHGIRVPRQALQDDTRRDTASRTPAARAPGPRIRLVRRAPTAPTRGAAGASAPAAPASVGRACASRYAPATASRVARDRSRGRDGGAPERPLEPPHLAQQRQNQQRCARTRAGNGGHRDHVRAYRSVVAGQPGRAEAGEAGSGKLEAEKKPRRASARRGMSVTRSRV